MLSTELTATSQTTQLPGLLELGQGSPVAGRTGWQRTTPARPSPITVTSVADAAAPRGFDPERNKTRNAVDPTVDHLAVPHSRYLKQRRVDHNLKRGSSSEARFVKSAAQRLGVSFRHYYTPPDQMFPPEPGWKRLTEFEIFRSLPQLSGVPLA